MLVVLEKSKHMGSQMKTFGVTTLCLLLTSPAIAQTATAIGTGTANSASTARSTAVAVSGQGGQGGNSSSSLNVISTAPAATTSTNTSVISGTTTQNQNISGTQTLKGVPNAYSPGLSAAGLETCLGSISGGGSAVGWGATFGTTIPDPGCNARLDARTLWSFGLKKAAVARLCLSADIYKSMPDICYQYAPQPPGYAPLVLSTSISPGPIELIDGKTGLNRMCDDYDSVKQRCRIWTGAPRPMHHKKPPVPAVVAINHAIAPPAEKPAVEPSSSAVVPPTEEK